VFAGTRSGDDLAAHYASADLFLFPSMTETFGNVTPEAMASGLPVVAYAHAAAGLLIRSGENGLLAPLADKPMFLHQAVVAARDRQLAAELGRAARRTASDLGWDRIVGQVEAAYQSALLGNGGSLAGALLPAAAAPA